MEFDALLAEMDLAPPPPLSSAVAAAAGLGATSSAVQLQWPAKLQEARALEKQIKQIKPTAAKSGGGGGGSNTFAQEKQLFSLRKALRGLYMQLILSDAPMAAQHDLEQQMWKLCVHKQIEALRRLLRAAAPSPNKSAAAVQQQRHRFAKLHECTVRFLRECMRWYEELCLRHLPLAGWTATAVQQPHAAATAGASSSESLANLELHPLPRAQLQLQEQNASSSTPLTAATRKVYLDSCHRSLIFRGDLERYQLLIVEEAAAVAAQQAAVASGASAGAAVAAAPSEQPWHRVTVFYRQALCLCPGLGNPYNQIAVVDSYAARPLDATYHYMRALSAAQQPFATAQVNVQLLLEKYRARPEMLRRHADAHVKPMAGVSEPLCAAVRPGESCCSFFYPGSGNHAKPDPAELEQLWLQLFDLLFLGPAVAHPAHPASPAAPSPSPPLPPRSVLPCLAECILYRLSFTASPWERFAAGDAQRCMQLLLCLLCLVQRAADAAAAAAQPVQPQHHVGDSVDPALVAANDAYAFALSFLLSFLHLLCRSVLQPTHENTPVVLVFLSWLRLHPSVLSDSSSALRGVRQKVLHDLASIGNGALEYLQQQRRRRLQDERERGTDASAGSAADSAVALDPLPEEVEMRGCALLAPDISSTSSGDGSNASSSLSSASIMLGQPERHAQDDAPDDAVYDDDERMDEQAATSVPFVPRTPAERRGTSLLLQLDWLCAQHIGLAKERSSGRFYSELDPATSQPAASALAPDQRLPPQLSSDVAPQAKPQPSQQLQSQQNALAMTDVAPAAQLPAPAPAPMLAFSPAAPVAAARNTSSASSAPRAAAAPVAASHQAQPAAAQTTPLASSLRPCAIAAGADLTSAYASLLFPSVSASYLRPH
jgi:hypothetical protein